MQVMLFDEQFRLHRKDTYPKNAVNNASRYTLDPRLPSPCQTKQLESDVALMPADPATWVDSKYAVGHCFAVEQKCDELPGVARSAIGCCVQ